MTVIYGTVSLLVVAALLAVVGQEYRYLHTRRHVVADRQALLHSASALHVATLVELAPGQTLLPAIRELVRAIEGSGGEVVYAGKVAVNALQSAQLPATAWDAVVLTQYASSEAYTVASSELEKARGAFASSYAMGMRRWPWVNLGIPVALLGKRVIDVVTRQPSGYPFEPAQHPERLTAELRERRARLVEGLLSNREYGRDAVVIVNFIKNGTAAQRQANSGYGQAMFGLMAELGYGPMHAGTAVTLEGGADFDDVFIVYYPGVEYFAQMVQSEFFTSIVGGKQLADTLSAPTVPLLPHL